MALATVLHSSGSPEIQYVQGSHRRHAGLNAGWWWRESSPTLGWLSFVPVEEVQCVSANLNDVQRTMEVTMPQVKHITRAAAYANSDDFCRIFDENVEGCRAGSFVFGLLFIWIATSSSLAGLDHELLTAHMAQHLLLMTLAPPLILLGVPRKPLAHGLLLPFLPTIGHPLRSRPMQQLASVVTHPALCWLAAAGTLVVWHIPSVFMLGLRSQMWHGAEQASFLATGLLFWSPVVRPLQNSLKWPESSMLLYIFLATLPCDILSGFLVFCDRVVYPVFLSPPRSFGLSALEDQQCAGALMWTCVTVVYLIAGAVFTTRLLSPHSSLRRSEELAIPQFDSRRIAVRHVDPHRIEVV
jgi:putative membrane protein